MKLLQLPLVPFSSSCRKFGGRVPYSKEWNSCQKDQLSSCNPSLVPVPSRRRQIDEVAKKEEESEAPYFHN